MLRQQTADDNIGGGADEGNRASQDCGKGQRHQQFPVLTRSRSAEPNTMGRKKAVLAVLLNAALNVAAAVITVIKRRLGLSPV